jgi:hypothetical protein
MPLNKIEKSNRVLRRFGLHLRHRRHRDGSHDARAAASTRCRRALPPRAAAVRRQRRPRAGSTLRYAPPEEADGGQRTGSTCGQRMPMVDLHAPPCATRRRPREGRHAPSCAPVHPRPAVCCSGVAVVHPRPAVHCSGAAVHPRPTVCCSGAAVRRSASTPRRVPLRGLTGGRSWSSGVGRMEVGGGGDD